MSLIPSPDARAVVAAVDRLTTQVRRLADAQPTPADGVSTPVVVAHGDPNMSPAAREALDALAAVAVQQLSDAPTTTADDGRRCVCGDPIELSGDPAGWIHSPGSDTPCLDARPKLPPMDPVHILGIDPSTPQGVASQQAPAADEDAQHAVRRERLHNLLARADRTHLTPGETAVLRDLVDTEIREADTGRAVAAGNLRHVQLLYADLRQAQQRTRQLETAIRAVLHLCGDQGSDVQDILRPALDGTEQPTTEA